MLIIWIIAIIWGFSPAQAGPWLRADGDGFLSVDSIGSIERSQGDLTDPTYTPFALRQYTGIFLEYGLAAGTNLGFSGGFDEKQDFDASLFIKKPLLSGTQNWVTAYEFGLGLSHKGATTQPQLYTGLSVGRSFQMRDRPAWAHIDVIAKLRNNQSSELKAEATLGWKTARDWLLISQVRAEKYEGADWIFEFAPSIALPTKRHRRDRERRIQLGLGVSSHNGGRLSLRLSLWRGFQRGHILRRQ